MEDQYPVPTPDSAPASATAPPSSKIKRYLDRAVGIYKNKPKAVIGAGAAAFILVIAAAALLAGGGIKALVSGGSGAASASKRAGAREKPRKPPPKVEPKPEPAPEPEPKKEPAEAVSAAQEVKAASSPFLEEQVKEPAVTIKELKKACAAELGLFCNSDREDRALARCLKTNRDNLLDRCKAKLAGYRWKKK